MLKRQVRPCLFCVCSHTNLLAKKRKTRNNVGCRFILNCSAPPTHMYVYIDVLVFVSRTSGAFLFFYCFKKIIYFRGKKAIFPSISLQKYWKGWMNPYKCVSVYLSTHLSIHPSIYLSIYIYPNSDTRSNASLFSLRSPATLRNPKRQRRRAHTPPLPPPYPL